jgi:phage replication initiation protein
MHDFIQNLISLTSKGISLNISRLDVAMDDKDGINDLNEIIRKAFAREYVSQARNKNVIKENISYKGDEISGRTIYFGSRTSSTYIRIYDKAAEQGVSGHWIRVEYEFKQENAMRVANSIALLGARFPRFFPEIVNGSLRFIELDDNNRSRCSVSAFWSRFLGTVKKAKLAIAEYKRKNISRLLQYMVDSYAPSVYTILQVFPRDFFLDLLVRNGKGRLRKKHYDMIDNPDVYDTPFSNSEKWALQVPKDVIGQLALAM